jgi:hypothetical protein
VLDIPDVEFDPLVPRHARAPVDLCPTCDSRLDVQPAALPGRVLLDLIRERGAGPDQAHVASYDIPELRDLVDRQPAEDAPRARDPRVSFVDGVPGPLALGADVHRAELHQLELLSVQAHAALPVEDGAAILEPDRNSCGCERGACDREPESGQCCVDDAVHRVPSAFAQTAGTPKRR